MTKKKPENYEDDLLNENTTPRVYLTIQGNNGKFYEKLLIEGNENEDNLELVNSIVKYLSEMCDVEVYTKLNF